MAIVTKFLTRVLAEARQRRAEVTEERVNITSNILAQIKDIKMMGLSQAMARRLKDMRETEVKLYSRSRHISAYNNTNGKARMALALYFRRLIIG